MASTSGKKTSRSAEIIVDGLRFLHQGNRVSCQAYVVMPDHVHLVFRLADGQMLLDMMRSFGGFTGRQINKMQGTHGRIWQRGYFEHEIRTQKDYAQQLAYVCENSIRKGLVKRSEDWPYSEVFPEW